MYIKFLTSASQLHLQSRAKAGHYFPIKKHACFTTKKTYANTKQKRRTKYLTTIVKKFVMTRQCYGRCVSAVPAYSEISPSNVAANPAPKYSQPTSWAAATAALETHSCNNISIKIFIAKNLKAKQKNILLTSSNDPANQHRTPKISSATLKDSARRSPICSISVEDPDSDSSMHFRSYLYSIAAV